MWTCHQINGICVNSLVQLSVRLFFHMKRISVNSVTKRVHCFQMNIDSLLLEDTRKLGQKGEMMSRVTLVSIDYLLFNCHKDNILIHVLELRNYGLDMVSLFHHLFLVSLDDWLRVFKELFGTDLHDIVRVWIVWGVWLFEKLENF